MRDPQMSRFTEAKIKIAAQRAYDCAHPQSKEFRYLDMKDVKRWYRIARAALSAVED